MQALAEALSPHDRGDAMSAFDPEKFAASVHKLRRQLGPTQKFTAEFARLVFRYFEPKGLGFDEVAFRIRILSADTFCAEMFVLGGGMLTITVTERTTTVELDKDVSELDRAPAWVTAGDRFISNAH